MHFLYKVNFIRSFTIYVKELFYYIDGRLLDFFEEKSNKRVSMQTELPYHAQQATFGTTSKCVKIFRN